MHWLSSSFETLRWQPRSSAFWGNGGGALEGSVVKVFLWGEGGERMSSTRAKRSPHALFIAPYHAGKGAGHNAEKPRK